MESANISNCGICGMPIARGHHPAVVASTSLQTARQCPGVALKISAASYAAPQDYRQLRHCAYWKHPAKSTPKSSNTQLGEFSFMCGHPTCCNGSPHPLILIKTEIGSSCPSCLPGFSIPFPCPLDLLFSRTNTPNPRNTL